MNRHGRRIALCIVLLGFVLPIGCSHDASREAVPAGTPQIRVLLLENQRHVDLSASAAPSARIGSNGPSRLLRFPAAPVSLTLSPAGWRIGNLQLDRGELILTPAEDGSVRIERRAYHGRFRFVPLSADRFNVINDVDVESYLRGVLRSELLPDWHEEAYRAQAIVARTYALYEAHTDGVGQPFDVFADQRSQVYGGIAAESQRSRSATADTAGIVVAYGPAGRETIFKAYFSSCCGGVGQSAADAFGDPDIEPLRAQNRGLCCADGPKYNWGPLAIAKTELTRRFRAWGAFHRQPERDMAGLSRIDIQAVNSLGRPVRFIVTDDRGARYLLRGEELREAVNTDAGGGVKIFSSFFRPVDGGTDIRFTEGHGYGHGVGMCQWCAERQARQGWSDEAIVLAAFPGAKLVRAY